MVDSPLVHALAERGVLVLDGAMATELERHGADLSGGLWSARLLLEQPELIAQVHRDYFEAGADLAITASYQASVAGFAQQGLSTAAAERLVQSAVGLAVMARDEFWASAGEPRDRCRPLVATSVGPYGAVLADGSEYRGQYDLPYAQLVRFHRERLAVLVSGGVEVLACETIPSLIEARAIVEAMSTWPAVTGWLSFSARNSTQVSDGTAISDCANYLDAQDQVVALGVNCTDVRHVSSLVQAIAGQTDKPIVVYPNSGETYDAGEQSWRGSPATADFAALAVEWQAKGARIIGGCCRTGPADIRAVDGALGPVRVSVQES